MPPPHADDSAPDLATAVTTWFADHARPLPWRDGHASAWAVLVSEVMLQQTPVHRVLPVYLEWLARWPTPAALASATPGDAVRAWGKLGYPRRALRLHACAVQIVGNHAGVVPADVESLQRLPGIGSYTARAVAAFAFGQRQPVVDTNVRRVVARAVLGQAEAGPPSTRCDLDAVAALMPTHPAAAARASAAFMELGALVCTARAPRCDDCPVRSQCAWQRAGRPAYTGPRVRPQSFTGTDRQARGRLMDVLRSNTGPVLAADLDAAWPHAPQRDRALATLLTDGLVVSRPGGTYALPT